MPYLNPGPEADARAEELLLSILTPEQQAEYREKRTITLTGSEGNRYRINCRGTSENVERLGLMGRRIEVLCAAPNMWPDRHRFGVEQRHIPFADAWVGQVLALRYAERRFREVAYISRVG